MREKKLSLEITSYDLLKTFAVIIMVIDHTGYYLFPEQEWWRAVGRIGFPIWFFLVGYSRGRDIPLKLIIGASILVVANIMVGMPIFPLNALVSIAIIRISIDYIMRYCIKSPTNLWEVGALLFILVMPTDLISEYGTQGVLVAIYGYLVRNKEQFGDKKVIAFMLFSFCSFAIFQQIGFNFSILPMLFMIFGTLLVRMYLLNFSRETYPVLGRKMPFYLTFFIQFCGHYTLEIYVVHLVIFKLIALYLGMSNFGFLEFELYSAN